MKKILITGSSSGIGLEIAKKLNKDGNKIIINSRDKKKLKFLEKFLKKLIILVLIAKLVIIYFLKLELLLSRSI